jgi:hypothetical protein
MALLIAHRGNINGRIEEKENSPSYIIDAIVNGYDVEVDVWYVNNCLLLGHDKPQYQIEDIFLYKSGLWIHCKNVEALEYLANRIKHLNIFMHSDDVVLTSKGYLWTAPGYPITSKSIAVMPELAAGWDISKAYGVCTDYPNDYK